MKYLSLDLKNSIWDNICNDIYKCILHDGCDIISKDITYSEWKNLKSNDNIFDQDKITEVEIISENVGICIGMNFYNDNYDFLYYLNDKRFYITSMDNTVINLIEWKYADKSSFILRYGILGFIKYLHIKC